MAKFTLTIEIDDEQPSLTTVHPANRGTRVGDGNDGQTRLVQTIYFNNAQKDYIAEKALLAYRDALNSGEAFFGPDGNLYRAANGDRERPATPYAANPLY